ncbi:hypothetical protein ACP70R_028303 [Stipagrostis hirtigluma subsp. patula]
MSSPSPPHRRRPFAEPHCLADAELHHLTMSEAVEQVGAGRVPNLGVWCSDVASTSRSGSVPSSAVSTVLATST